LTAQAGRGQRASREQVRDGNSRPLPVRPVALPFPGERGKGARAPWGIGLFSRGARELTTEGVQVRRIGVRPGQIDSSGVALMAGLLCGESRSGPDPSKLGWRGSARTAAPPGDVARGAGPKPDPRSPGHDGASSPIVSGQRSAGVAGDPRLCSWIAWIAEVVGGARQSIAQAGIAGFVGDGRRSGSRKRAAFDEAAGDGGPGGSSVGGESNPVNPTEGARQRAPEAGSRPSLPADNAGKRERRSEGF